MSQSDPAVHVPDVAVDALLMADPAAVLAYARKYLIAVASGEARVRQPSKQIFSTKAEGDIRVMPCLVDGPDGSTYTVKIVGTNRAQQRLPHQITVGEVCLIDPTESFVSHRFDACLFSSARTGLCAALALEKLRADADEVMVVGAGRVGYYVARFVASVAGVRRVRMLDINLDRERHVVSVLSREIAGCHIESGSACTGADVPVAVLATTSAEAFWPLHAASSNLVVSVGADSVAQHELISDWAAAELYTDTRDSMECGDLAAWQAAGLIDTKPPPDLIEVFREPPSPQRHRPRAFISTGSALLDNLTCSYLARLIS